MTDAQIDDIVFCYREATLMWSHGVERLWESIIALARILEAVPPGQRADVDALLGRPQRTERDLLPCQRIAAQAPQGKRPGWFAREHEALRLAEDALINDRSIWWKCWCGEWNPPDTGWCKHETDYGMMGDVD